MSNFSRGKPTAKGGLYYPKYLGIPRPASYNHEVLEILKKQHLELKKLSGEKNGYL